MLLKSLNVYWGRHARQDHEEVKTEIIVLANETAAMERFESFAEKVFNEIYDCHKAAFKRNWQTE